VPNRIVCVPFIEALENDYEVIVVFVGAGGRYNRVRLVARHRAAEETFGAVEDGGTREAAGLGRPAAAAIYYDDPNAITDFASLGSAWNPADVPGDTDGSYVFGGSFCGPFVVAPGGLEVSGLWCAATERVEARSPYRLSGMMTGHEADGGVGTSLPSVAGIGPSDIMIPNTNLLTSNRGLPGTASASRHREFRQELLLIPFP